MLSVQELISFLKEEHVVPEDVLDAFRQHVRKMERRGQHASSAAMIVWLIDHDCPKPDF